MKFSWQKFLMLQHLWNFDFSLQMYGAIFMMAGAYTLSTEAHVRGDVIYRFLNQEHRVI